MLRIFLTYSKHESVSQNTRQSGRTLLIAPRAFFTFETAPLILRAALTPLATLPTPGTRGANFIATLATRFTTRPEHTTKQKQKK
jgi:hypothetical protein